MAVTVVTRNTKLPGRAALHLLQGLMLLLAVGCSPSENRLTPPPGTDSTPKRVEAIQTEVKRIDDAFDSPPSAAFKRMSKDLPHWRFFGLLEGSQPLSLSADLKEGQVVRAETFYFQNGKLIFVKVEKWWDVDEPAQAPEPKTRQDFYIDDGRIIRHVVEVASKPPTSKTDDSPRSASALVERSRAVEQILAGNANAAELARSLEAFPEAQSRNQ